MNQIATNKRQKYFIKFFELVFDKVFVPGKYNILSDSNRQIIKKSRPVFVGGLCNFDMFITNPF
ncbi:MAG: hypothetical protein BGN92_09695 [Sphingobacteriales bacterium 41-5]|nr:MAG: hypothetical protein BGN92_09695 [Sphingobacteriales bacterium 41-5]